MKSCAILPIRKGSKSIPDKNIKPIAGQPLFCWALDAAFKCDAIDQILISTDYTRDELGLYKIWETKYEVIERPAELCTDTATTESALLHALDYTDAEIIVCLNACSPLVRAEDIDLAVEILKQDRPYRDSVASVTRFKGFGEFTLAGSLIYPIGWNPVNRPMRQDIGDRVLEVGVLWAMLRGVLEDDMSEWSRIGDHCEGLIMPSWAIHEIDEPGDWEFMKYLLELRKAGKI